MSLNSQSPLRNPQFARLFGAQVIALVGTGLSTVALALLAYDLAGGSAGLVLGTALAIKMIAYVVFAPVVGGLAQRLPRKPLLIALDLLRAATILLMPFATRAWHIYALIFVLNLFSAGFKPVFQATIPDVVDNDDQYTRALSLSRIAYDLENLLSPLVAGLALVILSYDSLFAANAVAFLMSALLIVATRLPPGEQVSRLGNLWSEISFGVRGYLRTPRLRALLVLYLGVAATSAMVIVNTVIYVRDTLGGSDAQTAMALAASGAGSMIAALSLPWLLERFADRALMLGGTLLMSVGLVMLAAGPGLLSLLPVWCVLGFGWSLVQTPAGRLLVRSAAPPDRAAYFSAQFSLSHACWLIAYPVTGVLGAGMGVEPTAAILAVWVLLVSALAWRLWPSEDPAVLRHTHEQLRHEHPHRHDEHHQHDHSDTVRAEPHTHTHTHTHIEHEHAFVIDDHHMEWPRGV